MNEYRKMLIRYSHEWNGILDSESSGVIINAVDWNEDTHVDHSLLPNKL